MGVSPVDGSPVYETEVAYMSASALEGDDKKGLRISKIILGKRLEAEAVATMLATGRSPLLQGFTSKRNRPFDAWLVLDNKGKISFEFPPRERKSRAGGKTAAGRAGSRKSAES